MQANKNIFTQLTTIDSCNDAILDTAETLFDSEISNEVFRQIPGIKIVMAGLDIKNTITRHIWIKKFLGFISTFRDFTEKDRERILNEANNHSEFLLEALDRIHSEDKPFMLGKIFTQYALENISRDEFLRMCHVIEVNYSGDLKELIVLKDRYPNIEPLVAKSLKDFGIVLPFVEQFVDLGCSTWGGYTPPESRELTTLGAKFIRCFL